MLREVFGILDKDPREAIDQLRDQKLKRTGMSEARATEIERLLEKRTQARSAKDFALSDQIRNDLEKSGILVMDTAEGSTWITKEN